MVKNIILEYNNLFSGINYPDFKVMTKMFNLTVEEILDQLYVIKKYKENEKYITKHYKHKNRKLKLKIKKETNEWNLRILNYNGKDISQQGNLWLFMWDNHLVHATFETVTTIGTMSVAQDLVPVRAMEMPVNRSYYQRINVEDGRDG